MSDIREQLADLCHQQWSDWMKYLFAQCVKSDHTGIVCIPPVFVERWERQMNTSYANLDVLEQTSDRIEANEFLAIIEQALATKDLRISELEAELAFENGRLKAERDALRARVKTLEGGVREALSVSLADWQSVNNHPSSLFKRAVDYYLSVLNGDPQNDSAPAGAQKK